MARDPTKHTEHSAAKYVDESSLEPDCARCVGLCCVAPSFTKSSDHAFTKPEGEACRNLTKDFQCGIYPNLVERGFPGCKTFNCSGAGQKVTQIMFPGTDWRADADVSNRMFAAFFIVKELHELIWALLKLASLCPDAGLRSQINEKASALEQLTFQDEHILGTVDMTALMRENRGFASMVEAARGETP
jgi:hypothetical protein